MAEITALTLPDEDQFRADVAAINRFQQLVHVTLIPDQDYGIIPGTQKPTLLKPGAEKIAKLLLLSDQYEIVSSTEDWDKPLFRYLIKCSLVHIGTGALISEGLGECNSMEAKYRWREARRKCPTCGAETIIKGKEMYGGGWICFKKIGGCGEKWPDDSPIIEDQPSGLVENEDIYSQVNTILKMGKKRALVDASLSAGRLSNIFTQDIEDAGQEIRSEPSSKSEQRGSDPQETIIESSDTPDLKPLKFKNVGEFYQACLDNFKLSKTKVEAEIPEYDLSKADQREKAWQQIVAIYGQKPS